MPEPTTMAMLAAGGNVVKGVSGYKAGQSSSKAAMATAMYNAQISQLNAQMEQDRGRIVRAITERNADDIGEQAVYNAFLLERQADELEDQNDFDLLIAERQYDIFTAQKRANWGNSGVTMAGSPARVALADAYAAAMNLANIEQRGLQAVSRTEQAAEMTKYKGKVEFNNMMQQGFMSQYTSDIQRANIINEGNMNYYAGASKAYQAQQKCMADLIGGLTSAALSGTQAYIGAGGTFGSEATVSAAGGGGGYTNILDNYGAGSAFRGGG